MYKIITPVVTAFDKKENIDYESNKKIIDFLIEGGVDGILVLGSTGEFTGMTYQEKSDFFKFYSDYVDQRVELYAGTGSMNFKETVRLSNDVEDMNYDGVMVIGPYYYGLDQEKIFIYYDTLAKKIAGNLYIYNFPARSGHSIEGSTVKKLIEENENIKGLKDSVVESIHTNQIARFSEKYDFDIYSGFDDQFLYNISSGGKGCIGGLSNIVPEIWSDLVKAANNNEFDKAIEMSHYIHQLMPLYDLDSNFSYLFKKLMVYRGVDIDPTAVFPFNQMSEEVYNQGKEILDSVLKDYQNA